MIRPSRCLAFLLACGVRPATSIRSKHAPQMLDDQITQTVRSTDALREQRRMLSAEWTLLNDPDRLRQLRHTVTSRRQTVVAQCQFTSLADLRQPACRRRRRLPRGRSEPPAAVIRRPPVPASGRPDGAGRNRRRREGQVVADSRPPMATSGARRRPVARRTAQHAPAPPAALPRPAPAPPAVLGRHRTAAARGGERPAASPRTLAAGRCCRRGRAAARRSPVSRRAKPAPRPPPRRAERRHRVPPKPAPTPAAWRSAAAPLLGMAHECRGRRRPLPRPMPVSSAQWSYSSGG